jgi:mannose-6-phosphate isomerase-like protein (cupin superfamily)
MADFTIKHLDDIEGLDGDDGFKLIRREMGITAFGITLGTSPPNDDSDPGHDHEDDGQEELYVVLEGSGTFTIDGQPHPVRKGHLLLVGPASKRQVAAGPDGMQVLTIGGVPDEGFVPNW